jgi:hypothetical protein
MHDQGNAVQKEMHAANMQLNDELPAHAKQKMSTDVHSLIINHDNFTLSAVRAVAKG